jgi:hypothetical protein
MKFYKKGAMFGLDARIALAIFGALSVISGAALYSAIQDSKVTSYYTDLIEVGKAWEAYLLDTGKDLPLDNQHRDLSYLVENKDSDLNWKGPYLPYTVSGSKYLLHPGLQKLIRLPSTPNHEWGFGHATNVNWFATRCDNSAVPCYLSIQVYGIEESLFNALDAKIDNSDGAFKGKIRMYKNPDVIINIIYSPYKTN